MIEAHDHEESTDRDERSRQAGRRMAGELVRWALEAGRRAESPLDKRIVIEAARDVLNETLASGEHPPG